MMMMIVSNTIVRSRHFDLRTQIHCNRPDLAKRGWHGPDLVNTSHKALNMGEELVSLSSIFRGLLVSTSGARVSQGL